MNKHAVSHMGRNFKRNSKSRVYSHAVLVVEDPAKSLAKIEARGRVSAWERKRIQLAMEEAEKHGDGLSVGVWGWCGRKDLADKQAAQARKAWEGDCADVVIVEVNLA